MLVVGGTPTSIVRLARLVEEWTGPQPHLVVNRVSPTRHLELIAAVRRWSGLEPTVVIPRAGASPPLRLSEPNRRVRFDGASCRSGSWMDREPLAFLGPLIDDPSVEEIIVNGGRRTFVVRDGVKRLTPDVVDQPTVRRLADQLLAGTGRRLDLASPIVSAQLPDGSRVHITGPPVARLTGSTSRYGGSCSSAVVSMGWSIAVR